MFTADERCGTMHDPAAKNEIKLTQSGRHAGRHFHKAVERLHHDFGAATGQVMFCGKSRRLCRGILSYRVPLATTGTLSGPAGMLGAAIRANNSFLGRSEEHTSELQPLLSITYAVF